MIKKTVIGASVALAIIAILIILFFRRSDTNRYSAISEAVPPNALIYIENADFEYFISDYSSASNVWKDMVSLQAESDMDTAFQVLNEILMNYNGLESNLKQKGLNLSLHLLGKSNLEVLFYLGLEGAEDEGSILNEIQSGKSGIQKIAERKYESEVLSEILLEYKGKGIVFFYSVVDGILLVSTSSILVEDAIRLLHAGGGIYSQKDFRRVFDIAGKYSFGNVYVNYPELDKLFYPFLTSGSYKKLTFLNDFATWGEFDIDIKDNSMVLTGMSTIADSLPGWLHLFKGQSPVKIDAASIVPSNASDFLSVGISNTELFKEKLMDLFLDLDFHKDFVREDTEYSALLGESPFSELLELLDHEFIQFNIQDNKGEEYSEVLLLKIRSRSEVLEKMRRWVSVFAAEQSKQANEFKRTYQLDRQSSYDIYQFPAELYSRSPAGKLLKKYFSIYDNVLIMSNSYDAITRTIYQNVLKKTMINEAGFEQVNNYISTKANLSYIIMPDPFLVRNRLMLNADFISQLEDKEQTIRKIPGLVIQFAQDDMNAYSNISICYSSKINHEAQTVWESLLDTAAVSKPQLVTNHNTLEKEIMVQDTDNKLYLLNSTGRILWEIQLDGPIMSEIYQVDYYKNKKLQYLFNTKTKLYLLDRNGNDVERYPVRLRSSASNGLSLFDYDKSRDYRIFIAGEDRRIYLYNMEGKLITGWNFGKTEGLVKKSLQHFRINDKDYIVFSDEIRSYFLDRRGRERIKIKTGFTTSRNNMFFLDMNISENKPRFVSSDSAGNVIGIGLDGGLTEILEFDAGSNHYFQVADLNHDGRSDYIFAHSNKLEVIENNGERLFSFRIKSDISTMPDIYEFSSSDFKIGLTDESRNLIYLVNPDGSLYEGFPLEGSSRFSIGYFAGSDSRFNLIVGSSYGFLYNYSIE